MEAFGIRMQHAIRLSKDNENKGLSVKKCRISAIMYFSLVKVFKIYFLICNHNRTDYA